VSGANSDDQYFFQRAVFVQRDARNMVETLVLRVRDPKDLMQISIEDTASTVASPSAMLLFQHAVVAHQAGALGKPSVVLARCYGDEVLRRIRP